MIGYQEENTGPNHIKLLIFRYLELRKWQFCMFQAIYGLFNFPSIFIYPTVVLPREK